MTGPNPVVGHKTLRDGSHVPIRQDEAEAFLLAIDRADAKHAAMLPTDAAALHMLGLAFNRLRQLGWREACYCPKDGSSFQVIEAGSSGIHRAHYQGNWPHGGWWVEEGGDLWPSTPILFKLYPEDQARHDARLTAGRQRYQAGAESGETE